MPESRLHSAQSSGRWRRRSERHPVLVFVVCVAAAVGFPFAYNGLLAVFH